MREHQLPNKQTTAILKRWSALKKYFWDQKGAQHYFYLQSLSRAIPFCRKLFTLRPRVCHISCGVIFVCLLEPFQQSALGGGLHSPPEAQHQHNTPFAHILTTLRSTVQTERYPIFSVQFYPQICGLCERTYRFRCASNPQKQLSSSSIELFIQPNNGV